MGKLIDLVGQHFGRLTVIKRAEDYISPKGIHKTMWVCECSCKDKNIIITSGNRLKRGETTSCGCYAKESSIAKNTKHGDTNTRLYNIWSEMKKRCYNENAPKYKNYGGRRITVCEEWLDDFVNFKKWAMENGYSDHLTIDRINNNGNYEPSNCRWATIEEQNNNRRSNKMITFSGETHNLKYWCETLSLPYSPIELRLARGWSVEDAFTIPIRKTNYNR